MRKEGALGTLFKVYSINGDEPRVLKVYIDLVNNMIQFGAHKHQKSGI